MPEDTKQEFTLAEVQEAISGLDIEDQHIVLASLSRQAEERRAAEESGKLVKAAVYFAVVYERATAKNASMSNIEGWHEELEISAAELLETIDGKEDLSELETLARDTAAVVYTYLTVEHANDDIDLEPLIRAKVSPDELLKRFRQGIVEACVAQGLARGEVAVKIGGQFANLNDFSWSLHPAYWEHIVKPLGDQLRANLLESGVTLPKLNEEGKYGEDDEPEI